MDEQEPSKVHRIQAHPEDTHSATQDLHTPSGSPRSKSRRKFLGNVRGVAAAVALGRRAIA